MRKSIIKFLIPVIVVCVVRGETDKTTLASSLTPMLVFADDFETDKSWGIFEEIVGNNTTCYGSGIGSIQRSTDVAYNGMYSLRVWANQTLSTKSNHVIAGKEVSAQGQWGVWVYEVHAYIAPETAGKGEVGPEFSIQNTRQESVGIFKTSTAGIQYVANPASSSYGRWYVWEQTGMGVATWQFAISQTLSAGKWYTLTVEADFSSNLYRKFSIQGDGINKLVDLPTKPIARESKGFAREAFIITVESENAWSNCGAVSPTNYKVYYDDVELTRFAHKTHLPLIKR